MHIPVPLPIETTLQAVEEELANEHVCHLLHAAEASQRQPQSEWTGVPVVHAFTGEMLGDQSVLVATVCAQASTDVLGYMRRAGRSGAREVLRVFVPDAVSGLRWLHDRGVAHGDLRWSNLLVSVHRGQHRCCLCDFGSELHRSAGGTWNWRQGGLVGFRQQVRQDWLDLEKMLVEMPGTLGLPWSLRHLWQRQLRTVRHLRQHAEDFVAPDSTEQDSAPQEPGTDGRRTSRLQHCCRIVGRSRGLPGTTTYRPHLPPLKRGREALFVKVLWK